MHLNSINLMTTKGTIIFVRICFIFISLVGFFVLLLFVSSSFCITYMRLHVYLLYGCLYVPVVLIGMNKSNRMTRNHLKNSIKKNIQQHMIGRCIFTFLQSASIETQKTTSSSGKFTVLFFYFWINIDSLLRIFHSI